MKIIIGQYSGFCNGVKYTIDKAKETVNKYHKVYCLGELVHNERVIEELEKEGLIIIDDINIVKRQEKLIIRAHGEKKEIYDLCQKKDIEVIDLTCGKIRIIKNKILKEKNDSYIIIIGKKKHPETIGILSFAGENASIIENEDDLNEILKKLKDNSKKKVYVVSQTTFSSIEFDRLVKLLKEKCNKEFIINKTICDATEKRQNECIELSKKVDNMIIVGGKNSSNTKELYNLALKNNPNTILIQDVNDLINYQFTKDKTIGIMAGASTPQIVIEEIINHLNK